MAGKLSGKKVAVLAADGFEEVELTKPRKALDDAGARTSVVSIRSGKIQGMNHADKGESVAVDLTLSEANPQDFDALMIPGGLMNPDALRSTEQALEFVRHFFQEGKPVAAICHAPWVLIDAGVVQGRTLTSWPAIKTGRHPGVQRKDGRGILRGPAHRRLRTFCTSIGNLTAKLLATSPASPSSFHDRDASA